MQTKNTTVSKRPRKPEVNLDPHQFLQMVGGRPEINFHWKTTGEGKTAKRRLIGNPNTPMRELHRLFDEYLNAGIEAMGGKLEEMGKDYHNLSKLPSSTGFVKESNPLKNASKHKRGQFFYITDIKNAYPSIDIKRLAMLIVYVKKYNEYKDYFSLSLLGTGEAMIEIIYEDPLFPLVFAFLEVYCAGIRGKGLAVGAPMSPHFLNLYCEVYLDASLRRLCNKYDMTYTRFADDLAFSRKTPRIPLPEYTDVPSYINRAVPIDFRKAVRLCVHSAGLEVNHRKSKVLSRKKGTVFITKVGLRENPENKDSEAIIVFPQSKRRRLHGAIKSYLKEQHDWDKKVSGIVAEFIYYFRKVKVKTSWDMETFKLCKDFEAEWAKWDHKPRPWIIKRRSKR